MFVYPCVLVASMSLSFFSSLAQRSKVCIQCTQKDITVHFMLFVYLWCYYIFESWFYDIYTEENWANLLCVCVSIHFSVLLLLLFYCLTFGYFLWNPISIVALSSCICCSHQNNSFVISQWLYIWVSPTMQHWFSLTEHHSKHTLICFPRPLPASSCLVLN